MATFAGIPKAYMRILHILPALHRHGTEQFVMQAVRLCNPSRHNFGVLVFDDSPGGYRPELEACGVPVWTLPPRRRGYLRFRKALDDFFRLHAREWDAVHFHAGSLTTLAPLTAARRHGVRHRILHMHGSGCTGLHNKVFHTLNRLRTVRACTAAAACSGRAARWGFGTAQGVTLLPNGIDTQLFAFDAETRRRMRRELGLGPGNAAWVHAGTFNRIKNQGFLLEVLKTALAEGRDTVLFLIGDGPERIRIMEQAKRMGLDKAIRFTGHRDDLHLLLQAMDLMLLPSLYEGCPFVLLEAAASGLPSLVSEGVEVPAWLHTATSLPLSNPAAWASAAPMPSASRRPQSTAGDVEFLSDRNAIRCLEAFYESIAANL